MAQRLNACEWLLDRRLDAGDGGRVAIRSSGKPLTYAELATRVDAVARALAGLGVRPEERVPLALYDTPEFVAAFLGSLRLGAVPVPLSTMLTGEELAFMCGDARARVAVADAGLGEALRRMVAGAAELTDLVLVGGGEEGGGEDQPLPTRPGDQQVASTRQDGFEAGSVRVHGWDRWVAGGDGGPFPAYGTWGDSPAFWLYTSGTTGKPKGAMHRHIDLVHTAETYGRQVLGITSDDRCLSVAKLFFAYGLGNSLTFPFSVAATAILDPARPTPQGVAAAVAAERPTLFFAVPTFYAALLAADLPEDTFASVRYAVSAGEPLPARLYHRFRERFGVDILDGIGTTEVLHIFISNRPGDIRPGSSGRLVPGYRARVVDDAGADVDPGEIGHLLVAGESVATGYWCRTEVTRRTFLGEWVRTGDMYTRGEDGVFAYQGRSDDMLKAGGIWVSPAEVEAALVEHADVLEAAVVGRADADGVVEPVAYVVRLPGREPTAEALIEFCRARLASFKRPRDVVFVEELPKTATGKIQRYRLRERPSLPASSAG